MTLWEAFEATAIRVADRPAVEMQRADIVQRWTYRDLHAVAVSRAGWLMGVGLRPGDRCAILGDNDAEWCAAYLGVLRAHGVVVPLDTSYSAAQIATIVDDAAPRVLFVNERLEMTARQAIGDRPHIIICTLTTTFPTEPSSPLADSSWYEPPSATHRARGVVAVSAQDPAVILYTSGTTADPKGVVLSHANLIAERDAAFAVVDVSETDSVLGVLPLFHALAQLANLLLPFLVGARVVFLETVNSTELVRALSERRITIFACVPQFFYLIHQRVTSEVSRAPVLTRWMFPILMSISFRLRRLGINVGPRLFGKVHAALGRQMRFFVVGGSKFDPAVGRDLYALGFTILQAYGLTETSGAVTLTSPDDAHLDTVGHPFPGHELKVLAPTDPERDGEIAIRGPIVMQGYFNRPDATSAVMRDGWLLTGDLGRIDADGRLTITGRQKEVIVLASGKNIYPEEVESHYLQSQYLKEICVLGVTREAEPTTERLFAVVVPNMDLMRERRIANAGDLIRFEMEGQSVYLPAHKRVLGYEIWFEPLPRTTTGKLKRHEIERRLAEKHQNAERVATERPGAPPQWVGDPHAMAAVDVIARRAPGATIFPESNLELDLGLDSMERVELLADLEQRFGTRAPEEQAHGILTVQQLIESVRPGAVSNHEAVTSEDSWAVLLRDLPSSSDPLLGGLLARRPLSGPILFGCLRLLRGMLPRGTVTGVQHLPARGPYIICPNHQSYLDPFFLCAVLPYGVFKQLFFVGASEYFATPVTAWLARQLNLVPVDPDANLVPAMKAAAFGLTHGKILVLFPEGERSIDGGVKRFKKGAPILSRHLGVPIVPVAMHGVFDVWPRNRALNWRALLPWSRTRVKIAFGPAVVVDKSQLSSEAAIALREEVRRMWEAFEPSINAPATRTTI